MANIYKYIYYSHNTYIYIMIYYAGAFDLYILNVLLTDVRTCTKCTLSHPPARSLTHSLIDSFTHSITHRRTHASTHPRPHVLTHYHPLLHSHSHTSRFHNFSLHFWNVLEGSFAPKVRFHEGSPRFLQLQLAVEVSRETVVFIISTFGKLHFRNSGAFMR